MNREKPNDKKRVLLEKLIKKPPSFYGTRRFIAVFIYWSLS
jgi:hypothetical protein